MRKGHLPRQAALISWLRPKLEAAGEIGVPLDTIKNAAAQYIEKGARGRRGSSTLYSIKRKHGIQTRMENGICYWVKTTPWETFTVLSAPAKQEPPAELLRDKSLTHCEDGTILRVDGKPLWTPEQGLTRHGREWLKLPAVDTGQRKTGDVDF